MDRGPLHLDLETRGIVDLKKVGAHRYAEDRYTSIILGCYGFGHDLRPEDVGGWYGEVPPDEVLEHVEAGRLVIAHSAAFERSMWNARILPLTGVPMLIEQMDCTYARGLAVGLPGPLEHLGAAVRAGIQKDKEGYKVMMRMCKPKKVLL